MIKQTALQAKPKANWFTEPELNHIVHFYPFDKALLTSLIEYFGQGLEAGDTCIVIATPPHLAKLNAALRARGLDINKAIDSGQYLMCDATNTLSEFMVGEQPDYEKFMDCIGRIISLAAGREKPIRAFGEMVALLWEKGNLAGLLALEEYWHNLVTQQPFSLYCAYPDAFFDTSSPHQEAINKICNCHSLAFDSLST